ncbi:MAG: DUF721 domain-containing protein [Bacteroidetes bacterium]|nr:DUF721 domain-containing protein [Bacteroidota bacterium]
MRTRKSSTMKSLGEAIEEFTKVLGIDGKLREYEAISRWEECVGARIAAEAVPERITKGILIVRVRSSVWRNELTVRKKEIITKVNTTLGKQVVKDIKFQ